MKPTISIALITLGLTFPAPAMAVDYVKCGAMTRIADPLADGVRMALELDNQTALNEMNQQRDQVLADLVAEGCPGFKGPS